MDSNAAATVIPTIVVGVLAAVLPVALGLYQLIKQHRNSIALQEAHLRHQIQLDIFREVADQLQRVAHAFSKTEAGATETLRQIRDQAGGRREVTQTGAEISASHFAASDCVSDLQRLLERYEIVFHRFGSARRLLAEETRRLHETHWELMGKVSLFLPHIGGPHPHPFKATTADVPSIEKATDEYLAVCGNFQGFVLDLGIEAQNCLLGELFQRTLPPRNPLDSTVPVLKADSERPLLARPPGRFV